MEGGGMEGELFDVWELFAGAVEFAIEVACRYYGDFTATFGDDFLAFA